jgi:exodeoxyribonuclease VII small subunit
MNESKTYGIMLEEVEGIVRGLSSGDIDLDKMVTEVEKGYELIKAMRLRLSATKSKLEVLRSDLGANGE